MYVHQGLAKSIGVSNYSNKKLAGILEQCRIKPHVHQVGMRHACALHWMH